MATKKTNTERIEREYVIPLRERCRSAVTYKKTPKAIKTIKEFLARHMSVENRDLKKVKLDRFVNEAVWARGIKKPLNKIKVKVVKENGIVTAKLAEPSKKFEDKRKREEKRDSIGKVDSKKKVIPAKKEKIAKDLDKDKDGIKDSVEIKEKEKSVEEVKNKEAKMDKKEVEAQKEVVVKKSEKAKAIGEEKKQ